LRKEIEEIIRRNVSDPRIGFFTITYVNVSPDLKHVKVGISFMGSSTEKETGFKGIKSATGYIQHKLGKKLFLKYTPSIEFVFDERKEYRIEELLSEIRKERDERDKGKD